MVENSIKGIARHKLDVVILLFSSEGKKVVEHEWCCYDGWTTVKLETVDFVDITSSAGLAAFPKDLHFVPFGSQTDGSTKSAETASDHTNFLLHEIQLHRLTLTRRYDTVV